MVLKAIIFGSNGQDGFYLSELLRREKVNFRCVSRNGTDIKGDVGDYDFVKYQIKSYQPDFIFVLAAKSTTSHECLFENHNTICTGTLNVLEAIRLYCPTAKVFLSGSAMQFKNEGLPIDEQTQFEASSPYSVARIQSVYAARYYRKAFGLKIYFGYLFNHDSPFRTEQHVNQKIIKSVKRIASGSSEKLELGNIDVKKEFNYAGDIVEAIWIFLNQTRTFEVVIGSGKAYSIREWLEYCFKKIDKNWQDYVVIDKNYIPEYRILVSNPKIIKKLGWNEKVKFEQLADMMFDQIIKKTYN
jgi:GDPmannose 4,6-dehydratase